jgi:hypothetical protein
MYVLMNLIYIKCAMENSTGYEVANRMVRSVTSTAMYTKMHIRNNVKISGKLRYPATLLSGGAGYRSLHHMYTL